MKVKIKLLIVILLALCISPLYAQEADAFYLGSNLTQGQISVQVEQTAMYLVGEGAQFYRFTQKLTREENDLICDALNEYNLSANEAYRVVVVPSNSDLLEWFICVITSKKRDGSFTYDWYSVGVFGMY